MQRESTPTAKRKRADSEGKPPTRSEDFWFDDGSVVLQVESTQFRVHRSILASCSSVFDDLFQVPQPESDKSDWVDGCPVVCMSGDTTEDWEHVLSVIYRTGSLSLQWPDVRKLGGMMRIGKKYQLDGIFKEAVERFKAPFPKSLGAMTNDCSHFPGWVMADFEYIVSLGEEMALWSILPITYYLVTCYEGTVPRFLRLYPGLSMNSVRSVAHGSASIWEDVIDYRFKWTKPEKPLVPTVVCQSRQKCAAARVIVLSEVCTKIVSQDIGIALDRWESMAHHEFCTECLRIARISTDIGRTHIWNNLGGYFFGDNWQELKDTKYEVWPAIWQPR